MSSIEPIQNAVTGWARALPQVSRVWLFGSRAQKAHREDSDVDLAIELDSALLRGEDPFTYWMFEKRRLLLPLEPLIEGRIDFQLYQPGGTPHVVSYVAESGVLIYEKPKSGAL